MDRSKFRIFLTLYRLISLFFRGKIDSFSNFQISSVFYIRIGKTVERDNREGM